METIKNILIVEHAELVVKINNLNNYIYSPQAENDNRIEFANKCIQLSYMKKYEECLRIRLANAGIIYTDGQYIAHIGTVDNMINISNSVNDVCNCACNGSDYDLDSKKDTESVKDSNE